MAFKSEAIQVEGLSEFRRELKKMMSDHPKAMNEANHEVAQLVVDRSQTKASSTSITNVAGNRVGPSAFERLAGTMSAGKAATKSSVRFGGAGVPDAQGWEFGAAAHRQFGPWRGSGGDAGYVVFPTIRESREDIVEIYGDKLEDLAARAFPQRTFGFAA